MIEELLNKIIEKLKAESDLAGITWHYGEPTKWKTPDRGEGYVSLAPMEELTVEPLMRGQRHLIRIAVGIAHRNINEEVCDKFVHDKSEVIWSVFQANENWDGLASESHLSGYIFIPGRETDYAFDVMINLLSVRKEAYPS